MCEKCEHRWDLIGQRGSHNINSVWETFLTVEFFWENRSSFTEKSQRIFFTSWSYHPVLHHVKCFLLPCSGAAAPTETKARSLSWSTTLIIWLLWTGFCLTLRRMMRAVWSGSLAPSCLLLVLIPLDAQFLVHVDQSWCLWSPTPEPILVWSELLYLEEVIRRCGKTGCSVFHVAPQHLP